MSRLSAVVLVVAMAMPLAGAALVPDGAAHPDHGGDSTASGQDHRSPWAPGPHDTCSAEVHRGFAVTAADGHVYDGWHPPVVRDPATGAECSFGHEHGDDPKTSDIYEFAAMRFGGGGGIPFGTVNHASDEYAQAAPGNPSHRHEDHYGGKVFVANDVALVRADRSGYATDASGSAVVCDYLIAFHQGTHSADAFSNNAHQILYAAVCSDGTELAVQALARMGRSNEYTEKCSGAPIATSGSALLDSDLGRRIIPSRPCAARAVQVGPVATADVWALYELWETDTTIEIPGGGAVRFDPWFGVRNPSRLADVVDATGAPVPTVSLIGDATVGWPWSRVAAGIGKDDATSPFTGSARDFYLGRTEVRTSAGHPADGVFYTDPYGRHPSPTPFAGAVPQYVASHDNSALPNLERWSSGFGSDYGAAEAKVHAPN